VKLLLDTHALIWFIDGDKELSKNARRAIESEENEVLVSMASVWEIAIKISIAKLRLRLALENELREFLEGNGFGILDIEYAHVVRVALLPFEHRDPFDRLLAAQSIIKKITLVSQDEIFDRYGVERLW
jgi:PIN domain nuclease of toxin-antitoxin system